MVALNGLCKGPGCLGRWLVEQSEAAELLTAVGWVAVEQFDPVVIACKGCGLRPNWFVASSSCNCHHNLVRSMSTHSEMAT